MCVCVCACAYVGVGVQFKESGIKLNPRRLYSADGHCVQELLKVASSLRKAMEAAKNYNPEEVSHPPPMQSPTTHTTHAPAHGP